MSFDQHFIIDQQFNIDIEYILKCIKLYSRYDEIRMLLTIISKL